MLTLTPPEARDDEIQVEPTEADSLMLKLSPTRVKANRNARGFNYIQLIVGMIIFVALSRIVGPPAFRMITRARSTALSANIQTAAETVRNVIAIEPGLVTNADVDPAAALAEAAPDAALLARLTDDAPFQWESTWELDEEDAPNVIRMQLIDNDPTMVAATAALPPSVNWLLNDWDAVRIHSRNQDGAWACALIVLRPNTKDIASGAANKPADADAEALADARMRGIWYNSGPSYTAKNQAHHCSPVANNASGATVEAPLPADANTWTIPVGKLAATTGTGPSPVATLTRSA